MDEMADIYAKLRNYYKFKYQLTFLAIFNRYE